MRIVTKDESLNFPAKCALTGDWDGPFIDTDTWLNARQLDGVDPYLYIHVQVVKDMAKLLDMVPKEELQRAVEKIVDLERQLADVKGAVKNATAAVA